MEKIKLQVSGSQIQVVARPAAITAGTVGLEAEFTFDSGWDGLARTVVFRAGDQVIATALGEGVCQVPWEVLEKPNLWLGIGVYGANEEGTVVIPTLWAQVAVVHTGVDPEGDPALEPANPIWQETLARVANMEPQVQEHINNTDNPHRVSCEQLGAVTQKEFRDVVSNLDGSSDPEGLIPHLLNQENPHGVTAAQAGAAPAGYGCSENAAKAMNWNTHYRNGFYKEKTNSPDGNAIWYGISCVSAYGEVANIAFNPDSTNGFTMALRHQHKGTHEEWEYVNPPMLEGVEYRTTERFNGKPVYVKLINGGFLANSGSKFVTLSEEAVNVVEVKGYLIRDGETGYFPLPRFNVSGSLSAFVYAAYVNGDAGTVANVVSTEDMSNYSVYIVAKYTKDTTA